MIRKLLPYLSLFLIFKISAQQLKSPSEFLGYELGTQFTRHAQVVDYFEYIAQNSDWVTYQEYGKTNERRPLTYAVISTPENLGNLEKIRQDHLKNAGLMDGNATSDKVIIWLSYNVHGNEASSTEAAMGTIYKLITQDQQWFKDVVLIMDPCVNPDGRDRYVNWYNKVKATPYDTDPAASEHNEPWPGGRANHYLFDLNRDWAWATQIETRQRLKLYNKWMPEIHVDFHEQGINQPYYFAPAAEPFHEIITPFQKQFQTEIGKNNAKYFDKNGWLFFTRERFDLLYPSYGDTYPIYMGAIGMTYEQAGGGGAGLGILNGEGKILTLVDRVAHHTATGLSTVEMASKNVARLNTEFKKYFSKTDFPNKSYILKGSQDKLMEITQLLDRQEIKYSFVGKGSAKGFRYGENEKGSMTYDHALVVSIDQPKGRMVKALFEPNANLSTPITYDITAWRLPDAYGLDAVASSSLVTGSAPANETQINNVVAPTSAGYLAKWGSMEDAKFLTALLTHGIQVRFTETPFNNDGKDYDRGSLVITRSDNIKNENFDETLVQIANEHQRQLAPAATSFAVSGPDFGSPDIKLTGRPKIAVLSGKGTSSLGYGSVWHFFEQELHYPLTSINTADFNGADLHDLDILIMPNGYYSSVINDNNLTMIKDWVRAGGKLIAVDGAVGAFANKSGFGIRENKKDTTKKADSTVKKIEPYADREMNSTRGFITGSIFKTEMDNTHPLAFGYNKNYFSLKLGADSYAFLKDGYNVGYLNETPENVAGFAGKDALENLKNSLVFGEQRLGRGSVIYMVDDPLFRAFWQNGKLLFVNALFFVNNNTARF